MSELITVPGVLMTVAIGLAILSGLCFRKKLMYDAVIVAAMGSNTHEEMDEAAALMVKADRALPWRKKSKPEYLEAKDRAEKRRRKK